ncbi:MAG TPA: hypothetical protein VFO76_09035 [Candidatus Kapabacteria bacterium]|nr:hypothetical protein [Candidatus Kapabacteria bacterium]
MIRRHHIVLVIIATALPALWSTSATAIPLFARKYSVTCFTCHVSPPLLNDFGRRFQANGYNLPGSGRDRQAQHDQQSFPIALLSQPMVTHSIQTNNHSGTTKTSTGFETLELALFSTASLGPHFSYFAEAPIVLDKGETTIELANAHLLYTDVLNNGLGNLNFRLGKMRAFIPFIPNTLLSNSDPLIYSYSITNKIRFPDNELNMFEPAFGVSAFGMLPQLADGLRWEVGLSGGTNNNVDFAASNAGFISANQTIYINNAPVRFGTFYYRGAQRMRVVFDSDTWYNGVSRIGVDLELLDPWTKRFDLYGQLLISTDNSIDDHGNKKNMRGGFVGVNMILMAETLYAFGRYDYLKISETNMLQTQIDIGLRWNVLPNVILTAGVTNYLEKAPQGVDNTITSIKTGVLFGF